MLSWDSLFLEMAAIMAKKSKDPSTQTGCVVVGPDHRIRSAGYNGFPVGVQDLPERYENRALKYKLIEHCTTPNHKTLTADLRWVELGSLNVGDLLVGFDEYADGQHGRRYRSAEVQAVSFAKESVYRVVLGNGHEIEATSEHRWLTSCAVGRNMKWLRTDELRSHPGPELDGRGQPSSTKLTQVLPLFEAATDYEAGWLAGLFDGEGTMKTDKLRVSFGQRPGVVLDTALDALKRRGLSFTTYTQRGGIGRGDCLSVDIWGSFPERLAFLGSIRPKRLLDKADPDLFGRLRRCDKDGNTHPVRAVVPIGAKEIVKVTTSTGTLFIDGYMMHNCDRNAIYSAAKIGVSLNGCIMYLTGPPCSECMRGIIQAGISEVVWPVDNKFEKDQATFERWRESFELMSLLASEAGIKMRRA